MNTPITTRMLRSLRALGARLAGVARPGRADQDFADELHSHIELHTDDNIRAGMTPAEARRQAILQLGGVAATTEARRDRRGLPGLTGLMLDLKLGGRMLVKYPGLTVIGGMAMAFGICAGTVIFQVLTTIAQPTIPLPQGDRLVQIRHWDVAKNSGEPRAMFDFTRWRNSLRSVTELGAWRDVSRNLIVDGDARPVRVAEITPSAFRITQATPFMGRVLTDVDDKRDAPPVAVIGYDVWQTRFGSDPRILQRTVQLGTEHVAIVGVMREGFAFPIAHDVWTPLRTVHDVHAPRSGPAISVFGLLAPDVTIDTARAEVTAAAQRAALDHPATHEHLQSFVNPYGLSGGNPLDNDETGAMAALYSCILMLLILISCNVALLLFARAATRENEIALRTALGASRRRIVAQLFAEALVLGGVAGVLGLAAAHVTMTNWGVPFLEANYGRLPFWFDLSISPSTAFVALGLTVLSSAIAGVMPALKVTRGMGARLKQASAGAGGLQFGGIWTAVIIVQVAVTVAFPAIVYQEMWQLRHAQTFPAGFPTEEYLVAKVQLDTPPATESSAAAIDAHRATFGARLDELARRVSSDPRIAAVTFADAVPRQTRPHRWIELPEDVNSPPLTGSPIDPAAFRLAATARIDPSYFDTLGAGVLAGRAFGAADLSPDANVAIVDQSFVEQVFHGRNPIGQQVRFRSSPSAPEQTRGPWMEIVGVVKDLGMGAPNLSWRAAGLYMPGRPERFSQVYMLMRVHGDPLTFAPDLREIAAAIEPTMRLSDVLRADQVTDLDLWVIGTIVKATMAMTIVVLVLSLSGIYAVLSFIVARRTREIGVRVALGAGRWRVIRAIFRRPLIQVTLGVLAGNALLAIMGSIETEMPGLDGNLSAAQFAMLAAYGLVMLGVCLLACIVPTRRALRVEPTVALRTE